MLKNVNDVPAGEVKMNNSFLNRRLSKIQEDERHAIDTSIETIYLLRIIVANVNGMLANGINLRRNHPVGRLSANPRRQGRFRKTGEVGSPSSVSRRIAQLEGSVLITFFDFEQDEIPFVHHIERGAYKLTLRSLYYNIMDQQAIPVRADQQRFCTNHGWNHAQESAPQHALSAICPDRNHEQFHEQFLPFSF